MIAARFTFLLTALSLCFSAVSCSSLQKTKSVEYAAEGSGKSFDPISAKRTPSTGALGEPTRSGPALPTESAATDSQSAMSQSADSDISSDVEKKGDEASETYSIPSGDKTEGEVRITALGLTDLKIRGDDQNRIAALHLRLEAKNEKGRTDWNIDSRIQQLRFSGSGDQLRPLFVQAESQTLPFIKVPVGKTIEVDLFYAVPKSISPRNAPSFELSWTLLASDETVAKTTPFKRLYPETRSSGLYPFEQPEGQPSQRPDPATKGTPMLREWWQDPYGYATPGSPVFNSYQ